MNNVEAIELAIVRSLDDEGQQNTVEHYPSHDDLFTERFCLEDIRQDWQLERLINIGNALRQLKGRKVLNVIWQNVPDKIDNPYGVAGRFVFVLARKNETPATSDQAP